MWNNLPIMSNTIEVLIDQVVMPPKFTRDKFQLWLRKGYYRGRRVRKVWFVTVYESNMHPVPALAVKSEEVSDGTK